MVALLEQQGQLDQQIGQVEQRILDVQHRPFHSKTPSPLMALLIDGKNNGNVNSQDDEVPMLEEYTVEDTYLDPFDENPSEVVPDPWGPAGPRPSFRRRRDAARGFPWP